MTDNAIVSPAGDLVARNPYRVLGLPGEAPWTDIRAAAERFCVSDGGEGEPTPWDVPWLAPLRRSPLDVERALARLADPGHRLRDRLVWFHESVSEMAVRELVPSSLRNALEGWSATSQPLARHDAAVVALLSALALDPHVRAAALWRRMFAEWKAALQVEEYWMAVLRVEIGGGFPSPASLAEVREAREEAIEQVARPLLELAREGIREEDFGVAARALGLLRESLPAETFARTCGDLAAHVRGTVDAESPPEDSGEIAPPESTAGESAPASPGAVHLDIQNPVLWDLAQEKADRAAAGADVPGAPGPTGSTREPEAEIEEQVSGPAPAIEAPLWRETTPGPETPPVRETAPPREPPAVPEPPPAVPEPPVVPEPPAVPEPPPAAEPEPEPPAAPPVRATDEAAEPPPAEPEEPRAPDRPAVAPRPAADLESPAPRPAPTEPDPVALALRPSRRRAWLGGAIAASIALGVALAALAPAGPREERAPEELDDAAALAALQERLDQSDGALAEAVVDRHLLEQEIRLLENAVEGYQILVDDYERRTELQLPADARAYRRVIALRDRMIVVRDSLGAERETLRARQDSLERIDERLVAAYNAFQRSRDTTREPSLR